MTTTTHPAESAPANGRDRPANGSYLRGPPPVVDPAPPAPARPLTGSGGINAPEQRDKPYLILISLDGFKSEYIDRFDLPHLRRLAGRYMRREGQGHTLQTSALVNEAYLRLVDQKSVKWQNRAHFFGVAAQLMRRILVDAAWLGR